MKDTTTIRAKIRSMLEERDALRLPAMLGDFAARTRRSALLSAVLAAEYDLDMARQMEGASWI